MGEVYAWVTLVGPSGRKRMRLLVDTGSTYTWVRSSRLRDIGVQPFGEDSFETIANVECRRPIGEAVLEHEGVARTTIVVFAKDGDGQVLGMYALEGLALEVDPRKRRLRKRAKLLAYQTAYRSPFSPATLSPPRGSL